MRFAFFPQKCTRLSLADLADIRLCILGQVFFLQTAYHDPDHPVTFYLLLYNAGKRSSPVSKDGSRLKCSTPCIEVQIQLGIS